MASPHAQLMKKYPELSFTCPEGQLTRLATVLQSGFHILGKEGDSVSSLLGQIPGFTRSYIDDEIKTVFLNGDAIDDLESTLHGPSATIALAGAMPGLAGAIVRKGSPWGALRKTKSGDNTTYSGATVDVLIKLFNTVAVDKGVALFTDSVCIGARDLVHFLELRPSLLNSFENIALDGAAIRPDKLAEAVSSYSRLMVKVTKL